MTDRTYNILFLCTANSARSIMAEAIVNHVGNGRFRGFSAGSHPGGRVHPMAVETLASLKLPVADPRSKSWDEFAKPDAPVMDFVLTVCDQAAGEVCPFWPGQPMTAHWGVPDPASVDGTEEEIRRAFKDTAITLKRRIELLISLPLARLNAVSLQKELRDIGKDAVSRT